MGYRLIALDIDGTIRSIERPISARTSRAVDMASQAGVVVTLATGRMFPFALEATVDLNITSPIVSYQGAHVGNAATGEVLWHRPLTSEMSLAALDALSIWKREVLAYHDDQVYVNMRTPWVEAYAERNQGRVHVVPDLVALVDKRPTRLVAVGEGDGIHELYSHLSATLDSQLHVTRSLPYFCEILHPEAGKHRALAWLCRHLGIRQDETVAFGNAYEDIGMLRWAGLGVAVSDAAPEILGVADRIAPPMEEDGPAEVLEDLLRRGFLD